MKGRRREVIGARFVLRRDGAWMATPLAAALIVIGIKTIVGAFVHVPVWIVLTVTLLFLSAGELCLPAHFESG
ncbi:MAG: hypothetical protein L0271_17330 [Gemmatimonadetes bacterium]|nr:hypothetical protein [Gemmatimonadota bacterium]